MAQGSISVYFAFSSREIEVGNGQINFVLLDSAFAGESVPITCSWLIKDSDMSESRVKALMEDKPKMKKSKRFKAIEFFILI